MKGLLQLSALVIDLVSWCYPLILAAIASTLVALMTYSLFSTVQQPVLLAAMPLLYLLWLFLFVCLGAITTRLIFLNAKKPTSLKVDLSFRSSQDLFTFFVAARVISMYRMALFMQRLPALNYSVLPPLIFTWMNRLVLSAYAPAVHMGKGSMIISRAQDPDLTYIGNNVVIGSNCQLVSHTLNTLNGQLKYTSAPIKIADNVTIGGDSRLGMGVEIGQGAVVEMGSNVLPYTRIAAGEVWGGSPATWLRTKENAVKNSSRSIGHIDVNTDTISAAIDGILLEVLRLKPEHLTSDLGSRNCADWDSLAKMAIAAALFDRFGLRLSPVKIIQLSSRAAVIEAVQGPIETAPSPLDLQGLAKSDAHNSANLLPSTPQLALPSDPDLLPLGDLESTTRQLARLYSPAAIPSATPKTVRIVATFTAQPLASSLVLWCRAFGINATVDFLAFNQVEQTLLSDSPFYAKEGINIVLVRPEDLINFADPDGLIRANQMMAAVRHYAQQRPGLIVSNLPPAISPFFETADSPVLSLRSWWLSELNKIPSVRSLDLTHVIESVGLQQARDSAQEIVTRAPYSQRAFQRLGMAIARLIRQTYLPSKKVIALDCDNTLWGGVIGEDGLSGIALGDDFPGRSFKLFQQALLALKAQGVLLVLVSKNEASDVWQVCDQHPDMLIKRGDIAAAQINWQAKSASLKAIAQELNLGLDAFVFIDDSPNERLEVTTHAPAVTVLPMPADPSQYVEFLAQLWCFDATSVTAEDKQRTQYMQQEKQRQQLQTDGDSLSSYLEALQLEITLRPPQDAELNRVAQLTQKTNQFNFSLIRRSLIEIQTLSAEYSIWTVSVQDRFGDYGLVGVAIVKPMANRLLVDTFLMSCRALGRNVELVLMAKLFEVAQQQGLSQMVAPYTMGPRNGQIKTFLQGIGFQAVNGEADTDLDIDPATETLVASVANAPTYPSYITLKSENAEMETVR